MRLKLYPHRSRKPGTMRVDRTSWRYGLVDIGLGPSTLPICRYLIDSVSHKPLPVSTHKVSKCSRTNLWTGFDGSKQNTRARLLVMHAFKTIYTHYQLLIKDSGWELCLNSFGDEMVAISNASRIQNCNFCKASLDKACHVAWSFVNCNAIDVQTHLRGDQRTTLLWFMISYWFFVVL